MRFIRSAFSLFILLSLLSACSGTSAGPPPSGPIGLNYEDGNGMDQLNCDSGNLAQIAADMKEIASLHADWIRIDASMTAVTGLPKSPACPRQPEFRGLENMLDGIAKSGAQPLLNLLLNSYDPPTRAAYLTWLDQLLDKAPHVRAFEIGNEENLAKSTEGYKGAPEGDYPYGWAFNNSDFDSGDRTGHCPRDTGKMADLDKAVAAYVSWLADSYAVIKKKRPDATIIIGGLASWQYECWTQLLGRHQAWQHADAIAYHPYADTPALSQKTYDAFHAIVASWPKKLPVWITEFGFTTAKGNGSIVSSEKAKADDLSENYRLLTARTQAPILYYTAREWPLTSADWKTQCGYVPCLPDKAGSNPGHIPGTADDMSGFGLFEWMDGKLIEEPAAKAFRAIRGSQP